MVCSGMGSFFGPLGYQGIDVLQAVVAGLDEVVEMELMDPRSSNEGPGTGTWDRNAPDGGDEGKAGEGVPLFGEVVVDELFAGALEAVGALFEGEQGGVADEDGGVGVVEHGVEVGGEGEEGDVGIAPLVKEDAGVGDGGAAGGVGGDGAQG
jgi:hypothetical protein